MSRICFPASGNTSDIRQILSLIRIDEALGEGSSEFLPSRRGHSWIYFCTSSASCLKYFLLVLEHLYLCSGNSKVAAVLICTFEPVLHVEREPRRRGKAACWWRRGAPCHPAEAARTREASTTRCIKPWPRMDRFLRFVFHTPQPKQSSEVALPPKCRSLPGRNLGQVSACLVFGDISALPFTF